MAAHAGVGGPVSLVQAAPRPAHLLAGASLALAAGVGAWSVDEAATLAGFASLPATAAFACLLIGLLGGYGAWVGPAGALLVVAYALSVLGSGSGVRADAALVGPALWLALEAAWWSLEARRPLVVAPGLARRRVAVLVATAAGSGALGLVLVDLAAAGSGGGSLLKAAGVAAALALVGLVAALARPVR